MLQQCQLFKTDVRCIFWRPCHHLLLVGLLGYGALSCPSFLDMTKWVIWSALQHPQTLHVARWSNTFMHPGAPPSSPCACKEHLSQDKLQQLLLYRIHHSTNNNRLGFFFPIPELPFCAQDFKRRKIKILGLFSLMSSFFFSFSFCKMKSSSWFCLPLPLFLCPRHFPHSPLNYRAHTQSWLLPASQRHWQVHLSYCKKNDFLSISSLLSVNITHVFLKNINRCRESQVPCTIPCEREYTISGWELLCLPCVLGKKKLQQEET